MHNHSPDFTHLILTWDGKLQQPCLSTPSPGSPSRFVSHSWCYKIWDFVLKHNNSAEAWSRCFFFFVTKFCAKWRNRPTSRRESDTIFYIFITHWKTIFPLRPRMFERRNASVMFQCMISFKRFCFWLRFLFLADPVWSIGIAPPKLGLIVRKCSIHIW